MSPRLPGKAASAEGASSRTRAAKRGKWVCHIGRTLPSSAMRIDRILDERRPVFSFEFFPPKTDDGQATLENSLAVLKEDSPDYVSVTYGAGGSTRDRTVEITKWLKQDLGIEAMAHLSCVGEPTGRIIEILGELRDAGIENILALRGDPPRGETEWRAHP